MKRVFVFCSLYKYQSFLSNTPPSNIPEVESQEICELLEVGGGINHKLSNAILGLNLLLYVQNISNVKIFENSMKSLDVKGEVHCRSKQACENSLERSEVVLLPRRS